MPASETCLAHDDHKQMPDNQIIFGDQTLSIQTASVATKLLRERVAKKQGGYSVAANAEKIIRCSEDRDFYQTVREATIRICDGVAVNLFSNSKIDKVNWPSTVLDICQKEGYSLSSFGAKPEISPLVMHKIKNMGVNIEFALHGYHTDEELLEKIFDCQSDIILLGLGSPRQEQLAGKLAALGCRSFIICCGGALDVISGSKRSAPGVIANSGFEWLYRLLLEPSRWRRYLALRKIFSIKWGTR